MAGKCARGAQKGNRNALKHAYYRQKGAIYGLDTRRLDRRYTLGRALAQWRAALIRDLGGEKAISTQQEALIDLAVKSKLLLDSIDAWLLAQPSLVNARKKALLPVVKERGVLADALARYLGQLGLERRVKTRTLEQMLAEDAEEGQGAMPQ